MKKGFEACCSVCGGTGIGNFKAVVGQWYGATVHKDPSICRDNLKRKYKPNNPNLKL